MAAGVVENVGAQFCYEHLSPSVAGTMDKVARCLYPTLFAILLTMVFTIQDVGLLHIVSHTFICVGLISFVVWVLVLWCSFPRVALRRALRSAVRRPRASADPKEGLFDKQELRFLFAAIDKDSSGTLGAQEIIEYIRQCSNSGWMRKSEVLAPPQMEALLAEIKQTMDGCTMREFGDKFGHCLSVMVGRPTASSAGCIDSTESMPKATEVLETRAPAGQQAHAII